MILGFEEITAPLNDYEKEEVLPVVVKGLSLKIGKENAVTNNVICEALKNKGLKVDGARIRKVISYIRINGLVNNLVSSKKGYYIATTAQEVKDYVVSLRQRSAAINAIINSFNI